VGRLAEFAVPSLSPEATTTRGGRPLPTYSNDERLLLQQGASIVIVRSGLAKRHARQTEKGWMCAERASGVGGFAYARRLAD
jgi:hypothetical protein